ncbi:MAG: hypothetical protein IT330_12410 [Anaerolineae bacterium]|nr:hypothetical protein [Anaerolineae bacterium]
MYRWLIFLHVLGAFGFLLAHGSSAGASFRLRSERSVERIRAFIELSTASQGVAYGSLGLLLLSGILTGFIGRWWGKGWIWAALVLFVMMGTAMSFLGREHHNRIRKVVGLPYYIGSKEQPPLPPASAEEIGATLALGRPMLLTVIGFGGLVIILWLMMFKPF